MCCVAMLTPRRTPVRVLNVDRPFRIACLRRRGIETLAGNAPSSSTIAVRACTQRAWVLSGLTIFEPDSSRPDPLSARQALPNAPGFEGSNAE
jgi:hypothetical protein